QPVRPFEGVLEPEDAGDRAWSGGGFTQRAVGHAEAGGRDFQTGVGDGEPDAHRRGGDLHQALTQIHDVSLGPTGAAQMSSASAALIFCWASSSDPGDGLRSTLANPKSVRL